MTLWASDTNYSDAGKSWDATPTNVAPSAGQIAQGFLPQRKVPMQWLNYAIKFCGGRSVSDEWTYPTAKFRGKRVSVHLGRNFGSWSQASGGVWTVSAPANDLLEIPILDAVPSGCTITSAAVKIWPGTARTGSNKMQLSVWKNDANASSTQVGTTASDNGAIGSQQLTVSGLTEVIDLSLYEYFVRLKAGSGGSTDTLYSLTLGFTDVGPRNF